MATTTIGRSIVIEGEISGDESLSVQGTLKGKVAVSEGLHIEESAVVEADVQASSVTVSGQLHGNVSAEERVEIQSHGRLVGDIRAPRVVIADGASFKGTVEMGR